MCVFVCVCVCVCVAKPVAVELRCHVTFFLLWIHLYLNIRFFFRVDFLSVTLDHRVQFPRVGLGQNLGHLKKTFFFGFIFLLCNQSYLKNRYYSELIFSLCLLTLGFFCFLSFAESFVVEQQILFGVDFIHISMISDVKVQC